MFSKTDKQIWQINKLKISAQSLLKKKDKNQSFLFCKFMNESGDIL